MPNYTPLIQDTFTQNILAREWLKGSGATRFMYMFFGTTLGNTATEIFVDGRASNRIPIPNESSVTVVAIYSHHNVTDSEGGAKINIMSLKNIAGTVTGNSATTTVSTAAATDDASPTSALTFTVDNTNKAVNVIVTGTAAKTIYHTALVIVIPATNPNLLSVFDA